MLPYTATRCNTFWLSIMAELKKDKQVAFFEDVTLVVGYCQFSLNDILHGK